MKKTLLIVCSVLLALSGLFGIYTGVRGVKDAKNLQDYKTEDSEMGLAAVETLLDGISQLRANEDAYNEGVVSYETGLVSFEEGQVALSAGSQTLQDGYSAYYAGKQQLEAGKAAYAEGKKTIEENTAAYEEGKATLAKIEPLMPYLNSYVQWRDGSVADMLGFSTAQAWFVSVVRPIAASQGLDIPADVTDFPAYIQGMVADGQAQLKAYEDGVAQLAEAEKTIAEGETALAAAEARLAQGENDLAAGREELAAGEVQLADGKTRLAEFEDGSAQVAAGLEALISEEKNVTGAYMFNEGTGDEVACPSILDILQERYGEDWSYWLRDEYGEAVVRDGCQYLDLDACEEAAYAAQDYINVYQGDPNINGDTIKRVIYYVNHTNGEYTMENLGHEMTYKCSQGETVIREVIGRYIVSALILAAAALGLLAAVLGLAGAGKAGSRNGAVCGFVACGLALAAAVAGHLTDFAGYIYPVALYDAGVRTGDQFSSHAQLPAVIALVATAAAFSIAAMAAKKAPPEAQTPQTETFVPTEVVT